MEIRKLMPGDEPALEAFLLPRIATSMFLLGNLRAAGLIDNGVRFSGTYVGALDGGVLIGVVAHYWNGMLMPQAGEHVEALWHAAVAASGRGVRGAIGPVDQVDVIRAGLDAEAARAGSVLPRQQDAVEPLFALELAALVVPEALRQGEVHGRRATGRDVDTLAAWRVAFEVEALSVEPAATAPDDACAGVRRQIDDGVLWILEDDDRPVAMTAFNTRTAEAVQVGGVYTPPELRGRGYARCAVAASLLAARDEGATLGVLFTAEDNAAAQRAYRALGFRAEGAFRLFMLREPWALDR